VIWFEFDDKHGGRSLGASHVSMFERALHGRERGLEAESKVETAAAFRDPDRAVSTEAGK
jgi:hypothetical protein